MSIVAAQDVAEHRHVADKKRFDDHFIILLRVVIMPIIVFVIMYTSMRDKRSEHLLK